ncbi:MULTISPECIES: STAS domain-containing protein [unclassified Nocardiopsis]|uniref:STAS domain-containing protein n=1 Tax=unclassified Nocardiopsis TaxID=2649073 RepID=UPI00066D94A1|nr:MULTISPECIES: STAS domain-containing protein [unclassified Nocardiopsis]MBQ1084054.1 STAS domain-containing protein [Nocardiopsis sp. B62]
MQPGASPVPVLDLGGILLVSIQGELPDHAAVDLRTDVTLAVSSTGARGVIIDISGLDMVDSFLARVLAELAASARLLAAQAVLVGMRPSVAITLVELGLTLPGLDTARTLSEAASRFGVEIRETGTRLAARDTDWDQS